MDEDIDLPDLKPSCSDVKPKVRCDQFPGDCLVCRNASTGYHYDVPSCNGCKSFFRRTLIHGERPVCHRIGKCYDTPEPVDMSRKTCRGCRFEKCVLSGMNPRHIQTNEVNIGKAQVMIAEVLKKRKAGSGFVRVEDGRFLFPDEIVNRVIGNLDFIEVNTTRIHSDGLPDGLYDFRSLGQILNDPVHFNNSDIPNMTDHDRIDKQRFKGMVFAHCSMLASVEYSKTFDFFRKICFDDKVRLTRHVTGACSMLHDSFFSITKFKSDRLRHPDGTEIGKPVEAGQKPGFHLNTLLSVLRNEVNRVEYMLLRAIVMCNSAITDLSPRTQTILEKERRTFGSCLLRYCRLQHGAVHGASRFAALLALISIIEHQVKLHKDFHAYIKIVLVRDKVDFFPVTPLFEDVLGY